LYNSFSVRINCFYLRGKITIFTNDFYDVNDFFRFPVFQSFHFAMRRRNGHDVRLIVVVVVGL